jgi:hypothetical protein
VIILDRTLIDPQTIARTFTEEYRPDLLGGVNVIHGKGYAIDEAGWQDEFYREEAPTQREVEIPLFPTASGITACLAKYASGCVHAIGN